MFCKVIKLFKKGRGVSHTDESLSSATDDTPPLYIVKLKSGGEGGREIDIDTNGKLTREPKIATFLESLKLKEQRCPHNGIFAARVFLSFGETFEFLQVLLGVSCIKS